MNRISSKAQGAHGQRSQQMNGRGDFDCQGTAHTSSPAPRQATNKAMTLQEAKSIARHLGLTLRKVRSGDYRVNFRDGNETTAYYTDDLEDAVNMGLEMVRKRA
jgi:hypothetical protein